MKLDKRIIYGVQKLRSPRLDKFFRFFTHIAEYGIMWMLLTGACFLFRKTRALSWQLCIALALCMVIGELIMKPVIRRKRPFMDDPSVNVIVHKPRDFSHPSGHSTSCFSCATVILFVDWRIGVALYVFSLLIAFSRVYLFVHYPSDVIFGALWGIAFGLLAVCIYEYVFGIIGTNAVFGWEGFLRVGQNLSVTSAHCNAVASAALL